MIRSIWGIARQDLLIWIRSPSAIAAALLPALGLGGLVAVLTVSIGRQPVALVQEGTGPVAEHMAQLIDADEEAYVITRMTRDQAASALWNQRVAAAIVIPADFDEKIAMAAAHVELVLNNIVDVDLADDVRRTVTRSLAELDAPQLGIIGERHGATEGVLLPNPFRVAIAEDDLRQTDVGFLEYQMIPILVLIIISAGVLGTGLLLSREFERRTAKMLVLAPVSRLVLVAGKLLGGVMLTTALVVPVMLGSICFGYLRPPTGHWLALLTLVFLLIVMSVSLGVLLGFGVRRTRLVAMVGLNAAAYLFFLGGGFSTVAFLPEWIQTISRFVPTSYAIAGLRQALFYPDLAGFGLDASMLAVSAMGATALATLTLMRSWRVA